MFKPEIQKVIGEPTKDKVKVSYHNPVTCDLTTGIKMLTWNITAPSPNYLQAGDITEQSEYLDRQTEIATNLVKLIKDKDLALIALQEVPNDKEMRNHLIKALKTAGLTDDWVISDQNFKQNANNHFGMLTIFNKTKVQSCNKTLLNGIVANQSKVLITDVVLVDKAEEGKDKKLRVANSHLQGLSEDETKILIKHLVDSFPDGQVVVTGDFDYLKSFAAHFPRIPTGNTGYTKKGDNWEEDQRSGFIFRHKPEEYKFPITPPKPVEQPAPPIEVQSNAPLIALPAPTLINHFGKRRGFEVFSEEHNTKFTIRMPIENKPERVEIHRGKKNTLFKSTSLHQDALDALIEAAKLTMDPGAKLDINVTKIQDPKAAQETKNALWLKAVEQGFVVDYTPDKEFLTANFNNSRYIRENYPDCQPQRAPQP